MCWSREKTESQRLNPEYKILQWIFLKTQDQEGMMMCLEAVYRAADSEVRGREGSAVIQTAPHEMSAGVGKVFIGISKCFAFYFVL